ncbi:class I SAM-dependent methyltransferase [uncultured Rummeliibacillus sp.]|uniref:class I SAM-dependent methyltransferase n=1 Tax=uncultured Rummeliibacillus sp. TaxID=762292 RepID=UPI0026256480|nr:class I SAM-dependent methyltransferase [uncultured Rummeliibacillus sp.]
MTNLWNERFNTTEYIYGEEPNAFIKEYTFQLENLKKVAAFAEGEGRNAIFLAKSGHDVTTFDYVESGLNKTVQLAEKNNVKVKTVQVDLLEGSVPNEQFDAAIMVFGHFRKEDQRNVFEKILKSVKPGGKIMMELYSEKQLDYRTGGPKKLEMLYKPQDILDWCENYKIVHFFVGEQSRQEGTLHTGLAHVIQLIIEK